VYTQLYIDYFKDKDPSYVKFFDESGFQLPDAGQRNFGFSPVGDVEVRRSVKILVYREPHAKLSGWI